MQFKQTAITLFFLAFLSVAKTQTTFLQQGAKEYVLLERLEIKRTTDSILNFSKTRPFSRKQFIGHIDRLDETGLSAVDRYNLYSARVANLEWVTGGDTAYKSRRPTWKHFYKTPANLYEVRVPDFYLVVNPVVQYVVGKETDYDGHLFLNTRGAAIRGRIANKVGFAAYLTDNQERDPLYVQQFESERRAVPGQGFYKDFKVDGYDYFDARGYFSFNVAKYIDVTFGYDRNFIGNGHRSLFLSDFSSNSLFLKLNTRIWKFNYQNIFMELAGAHTTGANVLVPKKYAALHHLDLAVTRWLNIGLFEAVVFGRKDRFDFGYLNPVIFLRSVEQQNGSFDNAVAGLDAKANLGGNFQLYTQFLLDEFNLTEVRKGLGWWGNKWALQAGAKYMDAFGISNLDLQVEANRVRPFTYSHTDSVANYTHYNQPLAHPLGANFQEFIGIARYQPAPRWMVQAKGIYYTQGRDTATDNNGSNILLPNAPPYRKREYGYDLGSGVGIKTALASFLLSYELRQNLFIEAHALYRKQTSAAPAVFPSTSSMIISAGVRWNMHRREFDF